MKLNILLLAALTALPVCAENDFGLWTSAAIQKDLNKKVSFNGEIEVRANDKLGEISRYGLSAGVAFKPLKFLHFGASYSFIRDHSSSELKKHFKKDKQGNRELDDDGLPIWNGYNHYDSYWRNKHRISLDATGKVSFGRFTLSLRERYQYTRYAKVDVERNKYRFIQMPPAAWQGGPLYEFDGGHAYLKETDVKSKSAKDSHLLRSRIKLAYNIKHCPASPYLSYEFTNDLNDALHLEKTRLIVGSEIKITKQHRLDVAYLFQDYNDNSNDKLHAISLGYKFKF